VVIRVSKQNTIYFLLTLRFGSFRWPLLAWGLRVADSGETSTLGQGGQIAVVGARVNRADGILNFSSTSLSMHKALEA